MQVSIGNFSLDCEWWGPGPNEAPSIILLHEGLGSISLWRDFPERLSDATGLGVFAYSRAGYGKSTPILSPWNIDSMQREARDILPELLDKIGFKLGFLLGHSDGASIATIYAGSRQDPRVRGVILIEPHFNVESKNLAAIRQIAVTYKSSGLRDRLARHHENVDAMFSGWSGMWLNPQFESFDIGQDLRFIRVPILYLKSTDDPYSSMEQVRIAESEADFPVEVVLIDHAGHSPHRSKPDLTVSKISEFVKHMMQEHGEGRMR
jgi:pimeloyl-ACP methyl ester carboxylesterase